MNGCETSESQAGGLGVVLLAAVQYMHIFEAASAFVEFRLMFAHLLLVPLVLRKLGVRLLLRQLDGDALFCQLQVESLCS